MDSKKNTDLPQEITSLDPTFEEDCRMLLEALSEERQNKLAEHNDPFDDYVQRMLAKPHQDPAQFNTRFVKGYQVLLNEIKNS